MAKFNDLLGKTLAQIEVNEDKTEITFITNHCECYVMRPEDSQAYRNYVYIEDICGDLEDLIEHKLLKVSEELSDENASVMWTFYKLSTIKGSVTIRWYCEHNEYYSESIDFEMIQHKDRSKTLIKQCDEIINNTTLETIPKYSGFSSVSSGTWHE